MQRRPDLFSPLFMALWVRKAIGGPTEIKMKQQILIAALLLCCCASFARADDKPDCTDPQDQNTMTLCAGLDYDKADKELNKLWPELKASAEDSDKAAGSGVGEGGYLKALMASQKAWITYRDAACTWEGFEAHGGSLEPMLVNGCLARLTKERIKDLTENQEGLAN
jgi:uncharacterized protein YecT (DUF1311 family)